MIARLVRLTIILGVLGGLPYAWLSDPASDFLRSKVNKVLARRPAAPREFSVLDAPEQTAQHASEAEPPVEAGGGSPRSSAAGNLARLEEVLRFDVNDRWIIDRWPRVSTILSNQARLGLRVSLVTGTRVSDLAGSLSYYLDELGHVRRITFEGHTGDESQLVKLARERFAMRPEPTLGAGLYLARWNGRPTSALQIRHAPIVRSNQPHTRLEVRLEINRPGARYSLSPEFLQHLNQQWVSGPVGTDAS